MGTVRTTVTMTLNRDDLDEVLGLIRTLIQDVNDKDHGVLTYSYFIDEDPLQIHVIEEYESSQAHLDHYANINQQAVARLVELVQLSDPRYYGEPTPAERELLAGFGNIRYHRPLTSKDDLATV
jgi:quinol monooxygenase YgiN